MTVALLYIQTANSVCSNYRAIPGLLADGTLEIDVLDTAVSRILRTKFVMGIFENPYQAAPQSQWKKIIHSDKSVALARRLDRESIVLLENNGLLPLDKKTLKSIAVIGPMAHGFMNVSCYFSIHLTAICESIIDTYSSTATTSCTSRNTAASLPWTG